MSNSGLSPYQDEVLTILMEECAEVVQEICKIKRFGYTEQSHHIKGKTHSECLESELGDLLAMIALLREANIGITTAGLLDAEHRKLAKVSKWMTHTKDSGEDKLAIVVEKTL
jgi:NTP pyrophosphatase (non-canonical NTP hydrolase)